MGAFVTAEMFYAPISRRKSIETSDVLQPITDTHPMKTLTRPLKFNIRTCLY